MQKQKEFKYIPTSNKRLRQGYHKFIEDENIIYVAQPRCFICGRFFKLTLRKNRNKKDVLNNLKVFICEKCRGQRYAVPFKSRKRN